MIGFGGNGAVFAAEIAGHLGIRKIIIPPSPGVFSAFGFLYADVEHHLSRTFKSLVDEAEFGPINTAWSELATEARQRLAADGFSDDAIEITRSATMRYVGQTYELPVPAPAALDDQGAMAVFAEAFANEHERSYGHRAKAGHMVEIVNVSVVAKGMRERIDPHYLSAGRSEVGSDASTRSAYFGPRHGWLETTVLKRADLAQSREGPVIVEEYDATCVVPPGARVSLDTVGDIVIELP